MQMKILHFPMSLFLQVERERLRKEKQLREEAIREKEDLERKFLQMQEDFRLAQENLVRNLYSIKKIIEIIIYSEIKALKFVFLSTFLKCFSDKLTKTIDSETDFVGLSTCLSVFLEKCWNSWCKFS